ncbi:MAG: amidophosphoribosyltransferase, partial [Woeseiaceae bacterium]
MCGVVGVVSSEGVNQDLYNALTVMQHRGQDAAGIVTWSEQDGLAQRKANGLV